MPDAKPRCGPDAAASALDSGCRIPDAGCRIPDAGARIQEQGSESTKAEQKNPTVKLRNRALDRAYRGQGRTRLSQFTATDVASAH